MRQTSLRIGHALELASSDPVATITVLRTLPEDSPRWAEARIAAEAAFVRGIPYGYTGENDLNLIEIHRDNRHLLAAAWNGGTVSTIDLVTHARTSFTIPTQVYGMGWMGPDHIAVARKQAIEIVDLRTHKVSRTIPVTTSILHSDHDHRVWFLDENRKLLELDGPDNALVELASDVRDISNDTELAEAVITHDHRVADVWRRGKVLGQITWTGEDMAPVFTIVGDRIALLDEGRLHLYHIANERIVDDGDVTGGRFFIMAMIIGNEYLTMSKEGLGRFIGGEYRLIERNMGMVFPAPTGAVQIDEDGALTIHDRTGRYTLGKRSAGLRRVDLSADGRFLVAVTETGDVLQWDLRGLRPVEVSTNEKDVQRFIRLTDHYLWYTNPATGVYRMDLATGKIEELIEAIVTGDVLVDDKERWVASRSLDRLIIYDVLTKRAIVQHPFTFNFYDDHALVLLQTDGSIETWTYGDDHPRARAKLDKPIGEMSMFAGGGNVAIVTFPDHVERFDLTTGAMTSAPLVKVEGHAVDPEGTCWLLTAQLTYRWRRGEPQPILFPLPSPPRLAILEGEDTVFYRPDSLSYLHDGALHTVSHASRQFAWSGERELVTLDASGTPSVVDLVSGLSYTLPIRALQIATYNGILASGTADGLALWHIAVPEKPAELRKWLFTITNAVSLPNSEAYSWPF